MFYHKFWNMLSEIEILRIFFLFLAKWFWLKMAFIKNASCLAYLIMFLAVAMLHRYKEMQFFAFREVMLSSNCGFKSFSDLVQF